MTDSVTPCDACANPAEFEAFAAYEDEGVDLTATTHPRLRRYPMPMVRSCVGHLGELVQRDAGSPGSTQRWLVAPIGQAWRLLG